MTATENINVIFSDSRMGQAMRMHDWAESSVGPPANWPALLRTMVNLILASPESQYLVWGRDELAFFSNDAYAPILGPRARLAVGTSLPALWPDAFEAVRQAVMDAFDGRASRFVDQAIEMAREGVPEQTWWSYSFSPVWDAEGTVRAVLCHTLETTATVLLEGARAKVTARLVRQATERDRLWEASSDPLLIADLQGRWLDVSPAWTRVLGWSAEELVDRTSEWLEHPADRAKTRMEVMHLAEGAETLSFENRLRTKAGDYRVLSWTARTEGGRLYCAARDITAERQLSSDLADRTRDLESSEARSRVFLDSSTEYVITLRVDADGTVRFEDLNANVEYLIGCKRVDAIGRAISELLPVSSVADAENCARACLSTGHPQRYVALRNYPNRRPLVVSTVVAPIEAGISGGGLAILVARDVTEERDTGDQLRHFQRMDLIGQVASGIAHDFNNQLSTISTSLDLLRMKVGKVDIAELDRYISRARKSVRSAADLSQRLLGFARKQALALTSVDLNIALGGMEELLRGALGNRMTIDMRLAASAWRVRTDQNQFENAILNLLLNARDAMPDGGEVSITTSNVTYNDSKKTVTERGRVGAFVRITVADNGLGMSDEVLRRAREPFFSTKGAAGTGLGLSMISNFATRSGGWLSIESALGRGTTVHLHLPRELGAPVEVALTVSIAARNGHGQVILLVESSDELREMMEDALVQQGYVVESEADPSGAVVRLYTGRTYALLVVAVDLIGMSGLELARQARKLRPEIPQLIVSGADLQSVESEASDLDAMLLAKPFGVDELLSCVGTKLAST